MTMITFISIAAVFVLIGLLFIIRGYRETPSKQEVVAISDIEEIKEFRESYEPSEENQQEEQPLAGFEDLKAQKLKDEIASLEKENERLQDALNRELSSKEGKGLADEEQKVLEQKDQEISELNDKIEGYTTEIRKLQEKVNEYKTMFQDEKDISKELETLRKEKEELNGLIEKLREQTEPLKKEIDVLQNVIHSKKEEYEKALAIKDKEIRELKETGILSDFEPSTPSGGQELEKQLDGLREELKDMEEKNAFLIKRDEALQYELTKSRAQAMGLEKICEDFKIQIERKA